MFKFVFTLFNLQGTDSSFRSLFMSAANFYILAHLVEFVKHFFQVFSNSFVLLLRSAHKRFITQPFYDITGASVCQEVFLNFWKFRIHLSAASLRLAYISTTSIFCQEIFSEIFGNTVGEVNCLKYAKKAVLFSAQEPAAAPGRRQ